MKWTWNTSLQLEAFANSENSSEHWAFFIILIGEFVSFTLILFSCSYSELNHYIPEFSMYNNNSISFKSTAVGTQCYGYLTYTVYNMELEVAPKEWEVLKCILKFGTECT